MLTKFLLLALAGGIVRVGLGLALYQRFGLVLSLPQPIAGALIIWAGLPDGLLPIPSSLPLGLTFGLLLPDLILARRPWM